MAVVFFCLAVICFILYIVLHQKADEEERRSYSSVPKMQEPPQKTLTYWERYRLEQPRKANAIIDMNIDFSSLSDKDVRERIKSIDGFHERTGRSLKELKDELLRKTEEAFDNQQIDYLMKVLDAAQSEEARRMNISPNNSILGLCKSWIYQTLNEIEHKLEQEDDFETLCKNTSIKDIYVSYSKQQRLGFLIAVMVIYDFTTKDDNATKCVIYTCLRMGIPVNETKELLTQKHSYFNIAPQLQELKNDAIVVDDIISTCVILAKASKNPAAITTILLMFFNAGFKEQDITERIRCFYR